MKLFTWLFLALLATPAAHASGAFNTHVFGAKAVRIIDTFKYVGVITTLSGSTEVLSISNFRCNGSDHCEFTDAAGTRFEITDPAMAKRLVEAVQWLDVMWIDCTLPASDPKDAYCYLADIG